MSEHETPGFAPYRPTRTSKPKVRTGCQTCKLRHVKCDETRPACLRCQKSKLVCSGYGTAITFKDALPASGSKVVAWKPPTAFTRVDDNFLFYRGLDALSQLTETESAAFDFCRQRSVTDMSAVESGFWTTSVLSACHSEPAVLHAAIALGAATRVYNMLSDDGVASHVRHFSHAGFTHYGKAVKHLQAQLAIRDRDDLRVILMACVILLCFDLTTQQHKAARTHLDHGRRILRLLHKHDDSTGPMSLYLPPKAASIDDELAYAFAQLDLQSTSIGGNGPQFILRTNSVSPKATGPTIPTIFTSIDDAARHIMVLLNEVSRFRGPAPNPKRLNVNNTKAVTEQTRLLGLLKDWEAAFHASPYIDFEVTDLASSSAARRSLVVQIRHSVLSINTATTLANGDELQYDSHMNHFATIVSCASALLPHSTNFKLGVAIIHPVYIVALHCRHPCLRRQAIEILSKSGKGGLRDSKLVESCAKMAMELEEQEACYTFDPDAKLPLDIDLAELIPSRVRCSEAWAFFQNEERSVLRVILRRKKSLSLDTTASSVDDEWETIERPVIWQPE